MRYLGDSVWSDDGQDRCPEHNSPGMRYIATNRAIVGIKTVIVSIRHIFLGEACIFRTAKLDANPKNIPKASLSCHAERSLPTSKLRI